jgi:O-antigen ligase
MALGTLPFLMPFHTDPIPSFYAEWLAVVLGLGFVGSELLFGSPQERIFRIPRFSLAAISLVAVISLQWCVGLIGYREQALLASLYLVWMLMVMISVASFTARNGVAETASILAWSLTVAATSSIAIAIAVQYGVRCDWLGAFSNGLQVGTLGQPNHFAHLVWLGIAGVLFLVVTKRITLPATVLGVIMLFVMSAGTGSRATFVYATWVAYVFAMCLRGRWKLLAAAFIATYCITVWFLPQLILFAPNGGASGVSRSLAQRIVFEASPENSVRSALFREAWDLFVQHPWFGSGWGGFRFWSYLTGNRGGVWSGGAEHSHNLFLNLLAESGVLMTLGVLLLLTQWFVNLWHERGRPEVGFLFMVAGIGLAHSQVEYPFWYLYFLAVFAVAIAAGDQVVIRLQFGKNAMGVILFMALTISLVIGRDYVLLEHYSRPTNAVADKEFSERRINGFLELRRTSIFAPQAEMALIALIPPTKESLEEKLELCSRSIAYHPSIPGVFTCALLSELAGRRDEASRRWALAIAAGGSATAADYVRRQREALAPQDIIPLERLLNITSRSPPTSIYRPN